MGTEKNWTVSYENQPQELSNPGEGDDQIRDLKTTIRAKVGREHYFTPSVDSGALGRQGAHQPGSAFPFIQGTEPQQRVNGNNFEKDYDEGRLWIDTSSGGRLMYLDTIIDSPYAVTWKPVKLESVGKIQAFVSQPPSNDRWLPCDGRLITDSDTSIDGTDGGYEDLIDFLIAEHGGNVNHPYYTGNSTSAYIPDLRGVSLRGLDSFNGAGSTEGAADRDADGVRFSGEYQEDAVVDHDHKMDHTHGASIVGGHDSGNGRTGTGTWNAGTVSMSNDGDHNHLYYRGAQENDTNDGNDKGMENYEQRSTHGDGSHHHTILRHYGLTRKTSDQSAETDYDIPDRSSDWNTSSENVVKNVSIYWFIKY